MGGGGLLGGVGGFLFGDGGASEQAAAAQAGAAASEAAAANSLAFQKEMYQDTKAQTRPYTEMAQSALQTAFGKDGTTTFDPTKLNQYLPNEAFNYQDFQGQTLGDIASQNKSQLFNPNIDVTQDPSYKFRLNEGINALDKSASARGMLLSGAQQKAINKYAQETASQEYANAYNRALTTNQSNNQVNTQNFNNQLAQQNQQYSQGLSQYQQNYNNALTAYNSNMNLGSQRYNQLASVLGLGQTQVNNLTSANANYSNQYTNTQMQNANNLASTYAYSANANAGAKQANTQNMLNLMGTGANAMAMSDIRLKKNIVFVGKLNNGLNIYDFDYIWGGTRQRGVMAQEVLEIIPNAVITTDNGYYAVDYSKIGA